MMEAIDPTLVASVRDTLVTCRRTIQEAVVCRRLLTQLLQALGQLQTNVDAAIGVGRSYDGLEREAMHRLIEVLRCDASLLIDVYRKSLVTAEGYHSPRVVLDSTQINGLANRVSVLVATAFRKPLDTLNPRVVAQTPQVPPPKTSASYQLTAAQQVLCCDLGGSADYVRTTSVRIAQGHSCTISEGTLCDGIQVALKWPCEQAHREVQEALQREADALHHCRDLPGVLWCYGYCQELSAVVLERAAASLHDVLHSDAETVVAALRPLRAGPLEHLPHGLQLCLQLSKILQSLVEDNRAVYRLHSSHVLVMIDGSIRVSGACLVDKTPGRAQNHTAAALDAVAVAQAEAVAVFHFGLLMNQVLTRECHAVPLTAGADSAADRRNKVLLPTLFSLDDYRVSSQLVLSVQHLIESCWVWPATKRPTFAELSRRLADIVAMPLEPPRGLLSHLEPLNYVFTDTCSFTAITQLTGSEKRWKGQLVTGDARGLRLWDLNRFHRGSHDPDTKYVSSIRTLPADGNPMPVLCLQELRDGRLASGGEDNGLVRLWSDTSDQVVATLRGHSKAVTALTQLQNHQLASGAKDCQIKVWDVDRAVCLYTLYNANAGHNCGITSIAQLAENQLISGAGDQRLVVWNLDSKTPATTLTKHNLLTDCVLPLDQSPYRFASASNRSSVYNILLWNATGDMPAQTLRGHNYAVVTLLQTTSGHLASGSQDGWLKLWALVDEPDGGAVVGTVVCEFNCGTTVTAIVELSTGWLVCVTLGGTVKVLGWTGT